jgi:hypothetical protein
VDVEELARTQRKYHTLIILLQLVVHLGRDQSGQLALWERVVLVESLTMTHTLAAIVDTVAHRVSYIWLTDPATSGQSRSISSFNR